MKDLARLAAALVAALVIGRDLAIAAGAPAMRAATLVCVLVVLAGLTLWRDGFVTASAVALGVHYASALGYGHVQVDLAAPVVAALIVLHLDLLDLSASLPRDKRVDRAFATARLRHAGVLLALASTAAAAAMGVAALPVPGGETLRIAGVAGAVLAVAVPAVLLRTRR